MVKITKIPINYTYPKINYINGGNINMLDNFYVFNGTEKNTIINNRDIYEKS